MCLYIYMFMFCNVKLMTISVVYSYQHQCFSKSVARSNFQTFKDSAQLKVGLFMSCRVVLVIVLKSTYEFISVLNGAVVCSSVRECMIKK